ncbi:DUF547 domain-containing protein [Fulvivirga sp. M361]|uniref:DUF547 domain-containing protein n=1 Tax=Fulvivirga sp. M361 TaxID=2594266 RepID=UPI001179FBA7|nr:DUF547 domain-containing protein [Fulvivirga sp. M361]TRX55538.1 DUF547 domain-containing protein [Fulvivirga sp. M361]
MKFSFLIMTFIVLAETATVTSATSLEDYFNKANTFLKTNVKDGKVDYKDIVRHFSEIENLYNYQSTINLNGASDQEQKAFYINAYNLIVIYQIAKYYEFNKKSPMDQSGFFDKMKHTVAGSLMTLNQLEIKKLLLVYKDPRIHFVLACAAKSCPPLASYAFHPEKLEQQLETRTKMALNDTDWLRLNTDQKKVFLSKIFDWYRKDFTQNGNTVVQYINQYRDSPIPPDFTVDFYKYDWSLNEG